jgi:hypothetical protein
VEQPAKKVMARIGSKCFIKEFPNQFSIHLIKIYYFAVQIATKNPPFAIAAGGCYSPDKYRMPLRKKLVFTFIIWYIYYTRKET